MVTVTDGFCGAGGSSTGARNAGAEVRMAINHWSLAIETHNTNHPETDNAVRGNDAKQHAGHRCYRTYVHHHCRSHPACAD